MRFSARFLLASLLGLAGLSTDVDAHARLGSPAPWNARPSQSQVCGLPRGTAMTNPQISLVNPAAKVMNVQWFVVIGDGVGPLSASIDTTGKLNPTAADFKVKLQSVGTNNPSRVSQTPYNVMFTIPPGITCTGAGGTCTLRVSSTSNWVACATIQFQPNAPSPAAPATQRPVTTTKPVVTTKPPTTRPPTTRPPVVTQPPVVTNPDDETPETTNPPDNTDNTDDDNTPATSAPTPYILDPSLTDLTIAPEDVSGLYGFILDPRSPIFRTSAALDNQCVTPTNLKTCSSVNGQSVQLLGPDATSVDAQAGEEINFAMSSSAMFERPNTVGCRQAFVDLMCAQMFPPCGSKGTVVCTSSCQRVNNLCKPNATQIIDEMGGKSSHAELFDCSNTKLGFTESTADSAGNCPAVDTGIRPTTPSGTTSKPVSLSSTGRNHASSLSSSFTVVMGVVTLLLAFVARV